MREYYLAIPLTGIGPTWYHMDGQGGVEQIQDRLDLDPKLPVVSFSTGLRKPCLYPGKAVSTEMAKKLFRRESGATCKVLNGSRKTGYVYGIPIEEVDQYGTEPTPLLFLVHQLMKQAGVPFQNCMVGVSLGGNPIVLGGVFAFGMDGELLGLECGVNPDFADLQRGLLETFNSTRFDDGLHVFSEDDLFSVAWQTFSFAEDWNGIRYDLAATSMSALLLLGAFFVAGYGGLQHQKLAQMKDLISSAEGADVKVQHQVEDHFMHNVNLLTRAYSIDDEVFASLDQLVTPDAVIVVKGNGDSITYQVRLDMLKTLGDRRGGEESFLPADATRVRSLVERSLPPGMRVASIAPDVSFDAMIVTATQTLASSPYSKLLEVRR